jgi:hypothetical protein
MSKRNDAKLNLYMMLELYAQTTAAVILGPRPISVGAWIRKQMKKAFDDPKFIKAHGKDAETQIKKAKRKLRNRLTTVRLSHKDGMEGAFEKLSAEYGIPVARLKAMLEE